MAATTVLAAGATLPPEAMSLSLRSRAAPATAAMTFSGPLLKETQPLKSVAVTHEYQKHNYLQGGVYGRSTAERNAGVSGDTFSNGVAGDGSRFSVGFYRAPGKDWGQEHRAADEAGCTRSYARDAVRAQFITSNQRRSGFNVITGAEEAPAKDDYRPRGRV